MTDRSSPDAPFIDGCRVRCFNQALVEEIRASLCPDREIAKIARRYALLSDPTRVKILLSLRHGELCVCDVAHVLAISIAATSHQLRKLRDAEILSSRSDGKMMYYSLAQPNVIASLEDGLAPHREAALA